jgi:ubiquitin-like 1-activating enzyme E1 B
MSASLLPPSIRSARVLLVGAGGIGCELLKNLVCTGFRDIEVLDLDTIDVSNLNRQFLFRPCHVGRPKAVVAAEAVRGLASDGLRIVAHHGNVFEPRFGAAFVRSFDLVVNALDNMEARRHVNRLCLSCQKPLFEAGTAGYLGQALSILPGKTACLECEPAPTQKRYPICTIRSTPDKPIHW